ncbi:unnamed protein product, partial [Mesorhabditis spiculigera]
MVMRFVMMLYEFEVVTRTGNVIGDLPLVCAGLALLEQMAFLFWIFPMIIAERMFAMHFMWDYERNSRTWISTSILGVALVVSTIAALMMAICVLLIRDVFMFVGVPLCLGGIFGFVLTYRLVARQNSITLSNLEIGSSSYGLSAKYQAAENIKCFKLVRYFLLLSICADFFGASLVMISVLGSKTPTLETLIAGAIFEHWVTVFGIMFLGVAMYSVKEWRKRYLKILRIFIIKARIETPIETTMRLAVLALLVILCFGAVEADRKCGKALTDWISQICGSASLVSPNEQLIKNWKLGLNAAPLSMFDDSSKWTYSLQDVIWIFKLMQLIAKYSG